MKYSETHEWVEANGSKATIGVSAHAQKELGDIVYVELPKVGHKVKAKDQVAVLESTKAAADVYSPLSGTIVEVNLRLTEESELINKSPESEGWLYKMELEKPSELEALMDLKTYLQMVE